VLGKMQIVVLLRICYERQKYVILGKLENFLVLHQVVHVVHMVTTSLEISVVLLTLQ
jgi:hypothetical protein